MSIRVGDSVFIKAGTPATVRDRDELTGKLSLDADPDKVTVDHRHGYINGLTPENRKALYDILDQVKGDAVDPGERIEMMRVKLEELEQDPHNLHLSRYLRAEMVHLMNTYNIRPKEYVMYEGKIR